MRTRIYNARILTMEEKRPVFKGEIYIDGGKIFRIKEAKTEKKLTSYTASEDNSN